MTPRPVQTPEGHTGVLVRVYGEHVGFYPYTHRVRFPNGNEQNFRPEELTDA